MENQFTIEQITSKCKVSKQSIYAIIKKNKAFIDENSTRKQRKIYYNQAAMDFFLAYYQPVRKDESEKIPFSATDTDTDKIEPVFSMNTDGAEGQAEKSPVEGAQADGQHESQQNALQRKIDALEAEIGALRKQLETAEAEKKELLRQNGEVLLLLQMEKQEKQLLLPAPKKALVERIKSMFHKG